MNGFVRDISVGEVRGKVWGNAQELMTEIRHLSEGLRRVTFASSGHGRSTRKSVPLRTHRWAQLRVNGRCDRPTSSTLDDLNDVGAGEGSRHAPKMRGIRDPAALKVYSPWKA